jgi:serine phosphatase RsbU (regulator of sigma subunit)/PAS domain-containing protein
VAVANRTDGLPDAELLAILDSDRQGWALARSVREHGRIVDFELIYLNEAGARLLHRDRAGLTGGRYRELWPETVHDGTLPLYRQVVETRQATTRTVYYDRATVAGHFELWISPYRDGFAARFIDLRTVTVTPASLGGTRLYDMLDAAFDGFTLLRPVHNEAGDVVDFSCEYVNQIGASMTGRTVEDTIGRRLSAISPDNWTTGLFDRYREVAQTGAPWQQQMSYEQSGQVWEIKVARAGERDVAVSFRELTDQVAQRQRLAASVAQASALQAVTTALVAASTSAEVYAAIGSVLRPRAGGQGLALLLCHDDELQLHYHAGYEPEVVDRLRRLPLTHPYPATSVARTGQPRFLTSPAEFRAAQPDPGVAVPGGGRQAWAFLPLQVAGEVLGTLVVGYSEPREFDVDERATLTALAGLGAQALQRARLFEARTSIAAELQHALLPAALPDLPGLRHAARYLPWTQAAEVGGDWYDIIALEDGVVGVVIGDVVGHSAAAAAAMGQVRNALRAYAIERHSPTAIMQYTNQLLLDMQLETIATCCYIEMHLSEGTATGVLAGHPPPVLRTADTTGTLMLRAGPPLGVTTEVAYLDATFLLPPGATLLLYTDGLVEDRRHPIDQGLRELCAAMQDAPGRDPELVLNHVLSSDVGPQPRSDDVALVCLTVEPVNVQTFSARRRFRSEAISASAARRFAADVLSAWQQGPIIEDALILLDEVVTNAVQHTVGEVTVLLQLDRCLHVDVFDSSNRMPARRSPSDETETGRGLQIVETLAAAWGTEPQPGGGKRVWFELPLKP